MKRYAMAVALVATLFMVAGAQAATVVSWDTGVAGNWEDSNWEGSQSPVTVLGRDNGWRESDGIVADPIITLDGVGTDVFFDAESLGDFHLRSDAGGTGELVVSGGATLELESSITLDGIWTEIDAKGITVTGAGSRIDRTGIVPTNNGGVFVFGSWQNDPGEVIDLAVLDGGVVENEGQLWFGAPNDSEIDLTVTYTVGEKAAIINHGALRNGVSNDDTAGAGNEGEISFWFNYDDAAGDTDDSTYAIDMTGHGGRVNVGEEGIRVQRETAQDVWDSQVKTYEELYADDLLLADGVGGGGSSADFGNHFVTVGSSGSAGYELRSIEGAVSGGSHPGDISGDCLTNAIDAGTMFTNFGAGGTPLLAEGNLNGSAFIDAADAGDMFAAWTGDPGPAPAGTATAEYDFSTGELIVSVNGVVNWFIESASFGLTGDGVDGDELPQAGGAVSDNDQIIGETTGFISMTYTDVSLGAAAAAGLPLGDLTINWNSALGVPLETIPVVYVNIPEPTTLALAALGLCGVLATRRRRMA